MTLRRWALVALGGAALAWALGGEWVRISHGVRESHLLDVTVGLSFAVVFLLEGFASPDAGGGFSYLLWELQAVLQVSLPIVFVWGLLQSRLARSAVGDLVAALDRPLPPGGLQAALAHTLADPTLEAVLEGAGR